MQIEVKITRLREGAAVPAYAHGASEDAGVDLAFCGEVRVVLEPGERRLFPTGLALELPPGFEGQVRPRSGLALKKGITVLNSPGTIDPGYRGEVGVILINLSGTAQTIEPGERIAQLIVAPYAEVHFTEANELAVSQRSTGGFGSTGA
jgi:dUTP pyrophosphatase